MDECVNKSFMIDHSVGGQFDLLVKAELGNANVYTCREPARCILHCRTDYIDIAPPVHVGHNRSQNLLKKRLSISRLLGSALSSSYIHHSLF